MFMTRLEATYVKDKYWRLISPLVYKSDKHGLINVPTAFRTDFASILNVAMAVFGRPSGEVALAAVVHDFLYSTKYTGSITRAEADEIFLEALEKSGVGWFKRYSFYAAVRVGGVLSYREKSNDPGS